MTTEPYTPSPELVEACAINVAIILGHAMKSVYPPQAAPNTVRITEQFLTAAVAFRHPDGHPELVPWEQVRELVEAAQEAESWVWSCGTEHAYADADRLNASLVPFTQEPEA